MVVINLGCRKYHRGQLCIDLYPADPRVIKADAVEWLNMQPEGSIPSIYSKNLIEHLPDPNSFFRAAYRALRPMGLLHVITDNAEFMPFYAPVWLRHTVLGAHARNEYALDHCQSIHYCIFTKLHLRNHAEKAGFRAVKVRRMPQWAFARLELIAYK